MKYFAFGLIIGLVIPPSIILVADPTGRFETDLIEPYGVDDAYFKARVAADGSPVNSIILGTSTAEYFHPDDFEAVSENSVTINLAFSRASLVELNEVWQIFVDSGGTTDEVFIFVDQIHLAVQQNHYRDLKNASRTNVSTVMEHMTTSVLFNALKGIQRAVLMPNNEPLYTSNGGFTPPAKVNFKFNDNFDYNSTLEAFINDRHLYIEAREDSDPLTKVNNYLTFARGVHLNGSNVTLVFPPLYPGASEGLGSTMGWKMAGNAIEHLIVEACNAGIKVKELRDFRPIPAAPYGFNDPLHLTREGAKQTMYQIVGQPSDCESTAST